MSKYFIYSTKEDFGKIYTQLKEIELTLCLKLDWVKIKRSSLDQLQVLLSGLIKKLPKIKDSIVVTKIKTIDIDNIRLSIDIVKEGQIFNTSMQYNVRSNTAHHADIEFENMIECFGLSIDEIIYAIENRSLQIN